MTFPNVFNAAPGEKLNFLSFDHTTGRLVIEGTATVSVDGLTVTTDPDTGITHPGWHGVTPPGGPGAPFGGPPDPPGPDSCPIIVSAVAQDCGCSSGMVASHVATLAMPPCTRYDDPVALPLITRERHADLNLAELSWTRPAMGSLTVTIEVDGPLAEFMKKTGDLALAAAQTFTLTANGPIKSKAFKATSRTYDEMFPKGGFAKLDSDQLYGARIQVTETFKLPTGEQSHRVKTFYLYRWITVAYAPETQLQDFGGFLSRAGNTAAFMKTLNDGLFGWQTKKPVSLHLPKSLETRFEGPDSLATGFFILDNPVSGVRRTEWTFDPAFTGVIEPDLDIQINDPTLEAQAGRSFGASTPGSLRLSGTSIAPVNININLEGYKQEMRELLTNSTRRLELAWTPGTDGKPGRTGVDDDGLNGRDDLGEYGWRGSDDVQLTVYQFGSQDPSLPRAVRPIQVAGPAQGTGRPFVTAYVIDPANVKGRLPGPGHRDYSNVAYASGQFLQEFRGFTPTDRGDAGPDGVFLTADDEFTAQQLSQLDAFLDSQASQLLAAVMQDYQPVNQGTGAYRLVHIGGDVTMRWGDVFVTAGGGHAIGSDKSGHPVFGSAQFDGDTRTDRNGDGIILEPILKDANVPDVAKGWALAEELNTKVRNDGDFGVARNIHFESPILFAQYVANTVSHEIGHTFGLLDAYLEPPYHGFPGTAGTSSWWTASGIESRTAVPTRSRLTSCGRAMSETSIWSSLLGTSHCCKRPWASLLTVVFTTPYNSTAAPSTCRNTPKGFVTVRRRSMNWGGHSISSPSRCWSPRLAARPGSVTSSTRH